MSEKYNGWANYETWRVNLEIMDDYASSLSPDDLPGPFAYYLDFDAHLRNHADDVVSNYGESEGLAVDYARAFLDGVDWREIARHILDDYPQIVDITLQEAIFA